MRIPFWFRLFLVLALLSLNTWLWRGYSAPWVLLVSLCCLLLSACMGLSEQERQRALPWLLAWAAGISPLIHFSWIWPCDLTCQGATYYTSLFGLATWLWGGLAYAATFLATLLALRRPQYWPWVGIALWLCVGASLWFLWLSWMLDLLCGHCLAIHSVVLSAALIGRGLFPWKQTLPALLIGGLGIHAAYHHQVVIDALPPEEDLEEGQEHAALAAQQALLTARMSVGEESAPWQADFVIDPICPHCQDAWQSFARDLGPSVGQGLLRVRIRVRHSHRLAISRYLAELMVAGAGYGSVTSHLQALTGHSQRETVELIRRRWATAGRPDSPLRLEPVREVLEHAIAEVLREDARWLQRNRLLTATTPVLVLYGPDEQRQIWAGKLPHDEILQRIESTQP